MGRFLYISSNRGLVVSHSKRVVLHKHPRNYRLSIIIIYLIMIRMKLKCPKVYQMNYYEYS